MVDFLDRDDQEMVLFAERVLQSAARHHLHIHFHGVWKPTGLQRTYPNLFNHEGVLNLEYLKWIGAMTDWTARVLEVPLSFLSPGRYEIETWADAPDSADMNKLTYEKKTVAAGENLVLRLNSGGGQAVRFLPVKE